MNCRLPTSDTTRFYCHRSDPVMIERLREDLGTSEPLTLFCERVDLLSIPASTEITIDSR